MQIRQTLVVRHDLLQLLLGDRVLREDPLLQDLLAVEDPGRRDDRRPPLEIRVDGRIRGQVVLLPLAQEVELILTGDRRDLLAASSNASAAATLVAPASIQMPSSSPSRAM